MAFVHCMWSSHICVFLDYSRRTLALSSVGCISNLQDSEKGEALEFHMELSNTCIYCVSVMTSFSLWGMWGCRYIGLASLSSKTIQLDILRFLLFFSP